MVIIFQNHLLEKFVKTKLKVATLIATWGVICTSFMTVTISSFLEINQQEHKVINLYEKVNI